MYKKKKWARGHCSLLSYVAMLALVLVCWSRPAKEGKRHLSLVINGEVPSSYVSNVVLLSSPLSTKGKARGTCSNYHEEKVWFKLQSNGLYVALV